MTTTPDLPDFRELCEELLDELQGYKVAHPMHCRARLNRARAALATPPPEPPTDDELSEMFDENDWSLRALYNLGVAHGQAGSQEVNVYQPFTDKP